MNGRWRWAIVGLGAAVLAGLPVALAHRPVGSSDIGAAQLAQRVQRSAPIAFSGYAQSTGGLSLPDGGAFSSITDLLGGTTQLRAWWRAPTDWRVDTVSLTGESDVHEVGATMWTWDYESNQALESPVPDPSLVRLPTAADLLPATLARRLLSGARPDELNRLPAKRIAGRAAPGLRLIPRTAASTITAVDIWVDPGSGVALRVDVHGATGLVLTTGFLDFSTARPAEVTVAFEPPPGARVRQEQGLDVRALAEQLGVGSLPPVLAGIPRNADLSAPGPIGIYGRGVTEFAVTPLFGRFARDLGNQLDKIPAEQRTTAGRAVTIGPLSVLLTDGLRLDNDGGPRTRAWLLIGTVVASRLQSAATALLASGR